MPPGVSKFILNFVYHKGRFGTHNVLEIGYGGRPIKITVNEGEFTCSGNELARTSGRRREYISEVLKKITDETRVVYGVPVYTLKALNLEKILDENGKLLITADIPHEPLNSSKDRETVDSSSGKLLNSSNNSNESHNQDCDRETPLREKREKKREKEERDVKQTSPKKKKNHASHENKESGSVRSRPHLDSLFTMKDKLPWDRLYDVMVKYDYKHEEITSHPEYKSILSKAKK